MYGIAPERSFISMTDDEKSRPNCPLCCLFNLDGLPPAAHGDVRWSSEVAWVLSAREMLTGKPAGSSFRLAKMVSVVLKISTALEQLPCNVTTIAKEASSSYQFMPTPTPPISTNV